MSGHEWFAIGVVLASLFLGLPGIRLLTRHLGASQEVARKSIHVAMGLSCAVFPWIFDRALPVWILTAMATVPLLLIRIFPRLKSGVGSALHGIKRPSYGEVLFAPAVASVFAMANGDPYLYVIPILILTIADAAGALVGTRWGKIRYGSGGGFKTVEGSMIFLVAAFLCCFVPLAFSGRVEVMHAMWIGLILGILAMMAEGISDRGFDNLVIPIGCFFILQKFLTLEIPGLIGRFLVLSLLLFFVLFGSRWSTLNGGALLGSVLLGYGCAVMADWRFALPPLAVFFSHLVTTRKHCLIGKVDHRLDAILSHSISCLPWVIASEMGRLPVSSALAGVSFAMGAKLSILDMATRMWMPDRAVMPLRSVIKGFLVASLPGLVWLLPKYKILFVPMVVALMSIWLVTLLFHKLDSVYTGHETGLWIIKGLLALAASTPALLLI